MPFRSSYTASRLQQPRPPEFDPANAALQVGYREISGTMTGVDDPLTINSWAIGFSGASAAFVRYEDIKSILGNVGGDGLVAIRLSGIVGDLFGSMSERVDLVGESAIVYITSNRDQPDDHGALMVGLNHALVQLISVVPYERVAPLRPTYLLEDMAANMEARSPEQYANVDPDRSELMDRLPSLQDLPLVLENATIIEETYVVAQ